MLQSSSTLSSRSRHNLSLALSRFIGIELHSEESSVAFSRSIGMELHRWWGVHCVNCTEHEFWRTLARVQMWQSRVEIEHYSIACFIHITTFKPVTQNFREGWGSYALCKPVKHSWVYTANMSPTHNRSTLLERFKHRIIMIKMRHEIMFNFYPGLP